MPNPVCYGCKGEISDVVAGSYQLKIYSNPSECNEYWAHNKLSCLGLGLTNLVKEDKFSKDKRLELHLVK